MPNLLSNLRNEQVGATTIDRGGNDQVRTPTKLVRKLVKGRQEPRV